MIAGSGWLAQAKEIVQEAPRENEIHEFFPMMYAT